MSMDMELYHDKTVHGGFLWGGRITGRIHLVCIVFTFIIIISTYYKEKKMG